jgi:hypothetical protein
MPDSVSEVLQHLVDAGCCYLSHAVFNHPADPSHDTVLHHGLGGLSRDKAASAEVQEYSMDQQGYSVKR